MTNPMYFSHEESKTITPYNELNGPIRINHELYLLVLHDFQQNMRVLLDTHLLRFLLNANARRTSKKLVPKSKASFKVGTNPPLAIINYITNAEMKAEYNEMHYTEFTECYLAPLDNALKRAEIQSSVLLPNYDRPRGDPLDCEMYIQRYYDGLISLTIDLLYRSIHGDGSYFGSHGLFRAPHYRSKLIGPDIIHCLKNSIDEPPNICFALGDFKIGEYKLAEGFEHLKAAIQRCNLILAWRRQLRQEGNQGCI